jgi:hypothetical protein
MELTDEFILYLHEAELLSEMDYRAKSTEERRIIYNSYRAVRKPQHQGMCSCYLYLILIILLYICYYQYLVLLNSYHDLSFIYILR